MNLHILLSALRARFRVLATIVGVTFLFALLVSLLMPRTYVATVDLVVDGQSDQQMNNSPVREADLRERSGYIQTQVDILTSRKVAAGAVRDLNLAEQPAAIKAFRKATDGDGNIVDWLAGVLLLDLKVDTTQSSLIRLSYAADDPVFAARVANAFAKSYMDTSLQLRVEPSKQTAAWFDEQMKGLRANLEQAQKRLADYEKTKGIVDERFDIDNLALNDLAAEVAKARNRRAGVVVPEAEIVAANQNLRSELLRSESKLMELSARLGTSHPAYQRQQAEVNSLRNKLAGLSGENVAGPPRYTAQREQALREALEKQQARVQELKQNRQELATLTRDVEIAQKAYETAMAHSLDKQVESRANLTNISMLQTAAVPFKPTKPKIVLNLGLAIVLGTLLGLCVIYLLEMMDRRVRSAIDLDFQLPMLGELGRWRTPPGRLLGRAGSDLPALPSPG